MANLHETMNATEIIYTNGNKEKFLENARRDFKNRYDDQIMNMISVLTSSGVKPEKLGIAGARKNKEN